MSREFLRNNKGSAFTNLCNSTVIEIYGDKIRVSHGFDGCQILEYIAANVPRPSDWLVQRFQPGGLQAEFRIF